MNTMIKEMKRIMFVALLVCATLGTQAQILFKISGKGLQAPSYIVGTYHLASVSFVDSIPGIRQAMDAKLHNSCDNRPEEEDALIYNRNADWLKKMPALMAQKPTFFAVGAGHLPGERGVLNLLRKAGYTVEGVK